MTYNRLDDFSNFFVKSNVNARKNIDQNTFQRTCGKNQMAFLKQNLLQLIVFHRKVHLQHRCTFRWPSVYTDKIIEYTDSGTHAALQDRKTS